MSESLRRQAEEIRNEVQKGANTAERVGGVLVGIIDEVSKTKPVSADWNEVDEGNKAFIKNKPKDFPPSEHNHDEQYLLKGFYLGANTVASLTELPVDKRSVEATLSSATEISLKTGLEVGQELYIRCVAMTEFDQPIPVSGVWTSMSGGAFHVMTGDVFEVCIWCYANGCYSISIKKKGEVC